MMRVVRGGWRREQAPVSWTDPVSWTNPATSYIHYAMQQTNTTQILDTGEAGLNLHSTFMPSVGSGPVRFESGTNENGRITYAYRFNGANRFKTTEAAGLDLNSSVTVSCWVYMRSLPVSGDAMNAVSKTFQYVLFMDNGLLGTGNTIKGARNNGSAWQYASCDMIPKDQWVHLTRVFDGSTLGLTVYTNGLLAGTATATGSPWDLGQGLGIGAYRDWETELS